MLELGKSGSHGLERGTVPVLSDGAVVATLRAANWKEAATAQVGATSWVFRRHGGRELIGRWAVDPDEAVRLRARQDSYWKGSWTVDLDGRTVDVVTASMWKGTHRYLSGGRQVAESGSTGGWSPRPTLTADDGLPLHQQVFLLWVEMVISRRNSAAAAGGASAAVIGGT